MYQKGDACIQIFLYLYIQMHLLQKILILTTLLLSCLPKLLPQLLHTIDSNPPNYLIRGNLPIHNNKFQFKTLKQQLKILTNQTQYKLVVISLMNSFTMKENRNRGIQEKFFQGRKVINGTKIKYINYIVLGSLINPSNIPKFIRTSLTKYDQFISFDQLDTLLTLLRNLLNSKKPTIIYIHCSAGIDRTGYISGAYKMKYKRLSLKSVMKENLTIMRKYRKYMHFNTYQGLQWYCLDLGRSDQECLVGRKQPKFRELEEY